MALIKLLSNGRIENFGIYAIVGTIRADHAVLGQSDQGKMLHGLLQDLAHNRGQAKGTDIKARNPMGTFKPQSKWQYNGHNVMHYSTGNKNKSAEDHSVTVFFYKESDDAAGGVWVVIAAGHHMDKSSDYKIVWGEQKGAYATV